MNRARVTAADIGASNGLIHVIDQVLLPPNLVQAAELAGSFQTLASALRATGLDAALSGAGANTVFAPTDAAFSALPAGTLGALSKDQLTHILTYHVVSGAVRADDLSAGRVETLANKQVCVDLGPPVRVNDAAVMLADIIATNGVIHVIDRVLLP